MAAREAQEILETECSLSPQAPENETTEIFQPCKGASIYWGGNTKQNSGSKLKNLWRTLEKVAVMQ